MPKENSDELFDRIKLARDLLDEAVALLKKGRTQKDGASIGTIFNGEDKINLCRP